MTVSCWLAECQWNNNGWCERGSITIDELKECEEYEDYYDSYTDSFWKALMKDGKAFRRFVEKGKKIEYNGYVFYTVDKITDAEEYYLTEERTGVMAGEFKKLKEKRRWELFLERVATFPDVSTLPVEERSRR